MTFDEFDRFCDELYAEIKALRASKGKVYANSTDRFANFNRAAEKKGVSRLLVAGIFADKHSDAIDNFIKTGQNPCDESIRGRFKDLILYLFLMAGMAHEDEINAHKASIQRMDEEMNTFAEHSDRIRP